MPLKRERSDPETERSMSPVEQPTPPGSPKSTALSTPSSFGIADLYRTPVQTIVKIEDEMEEGEATDSDSSMEEGQIADTERSTPDSMDIGIPRVPSNWLQPSPP